MIKQEQSLKNYKNQLHVQTRNQCEIQEVFASRIQDPIRAQVCSTKDKATKSKSTKKKMLQSKDTKQSTLYKLKVLNQST